jgi:Na+-transporting NADH:ubiquinone oxidoreductase subunit C
MPENRKPPGGRKRDSVGNTLLVAVSLSLVCSLLVASTAVLLQPKQLENAERYRQAIILDVAGLLEPGSDISTLFEDIEVRVVNLADGLYADSIDASRFDAQLAARDPDYRVAIPEELDLAQIQRRASHAPVYILTANGAIEQVILPVYGAGLWSTMYGYLAVAGDGLTIRGLRFYEHGETPGLGDRIDDLQWRAQWSGKQLYDQDGLPRIEVVRGFVQAGDDASHQIDGISGATLTGRGVTNLIRYWTGPHGFGPYLGKIQDESDGNE